MEEEKKRQKDQELQELMRNVQGNNQRMYCTFLTK